MITSSRTAAAAPPIRDDRIRSRWPICVYLYSDKDCVRLSQRTDPRALATDSSMPCWCARQAVYRYRVQHSGRTEECPPSQACCLEPWGGDRMGKVEGIQTMKNRGAAPEWRAVMRGVEVRVLRGGEAGCRPSRT